MRIEIEFTEADVSLIDKVREALCKLLCPPEVPGPAEKVSIVAIRYLDLNGNPLPDEVKFMLQLPDDKKSTLSLDVRDAKGKKASTDGAPTWQVSDSNLLTVTPAADGFSAVLETGALDGVDLPATAQVSVTADVKMGPDVKELTGTLDVEIVAGEGAVINIGAGPLE